MPQPVTANVSQSPNKPVVTIDVIIDTICPWCLIGKTRLDKALSERGNLHFKIRWHPFLLNPDMPENGMDRQDYISTKFGGENRGRRVYDAIRATGESCGIPFQFDKIERTPNSVDSHRLIRFAAKTGQDEDAVDKLFELFFIQGRDIGQRDVLIECASTIGLDTDAFSAYLDSNEDKKWVFEENANAHRMGVEGVPAYVFDERMIISGAQEPEVLHRLIDAAMERTGSTP